MTPHKQNQLTKIKFKNLFNNKHNNKPQQQQQSMSQQIQNFIRPSYVDVSPQQTTRTILLPTTTTPQQQTLYLTQEELDKLKSEGKLNPDEFEIVKDKDSEEYEYYEDEVTIGYEKLQLPVSSIRPGHYDQSFVQNKQNVVHNNNNPQIHYDFSPILKQGNSLNKRNLDYDDKIELVTLGNKNILNNFRDVVVKGSFGL